MPEDRGVRPEQYHALLSGRRDGALVLDDLIARFDARLSFHPESERLTVYHEGQRSVVRWILETLASVEAGEPKFPRSL